MRLITLVTRNKAERQGMLSVEEDDAKAFFVAVNLSYAVCVFSFPFGVNCSHSIE